MLPAGRDMEPVLMRGLDRPIVDPSLWWLPKQPEPGGEIFREARVRRGGREFPGGAVCWNPAERCEGVCRECPLEQAGEAS